jgi:hypothetical protein
MARRRRVNCQSSPTPSSPVQQRLKCSLCHGRRSSRILDSGPDDTLDRFICSRTECSELKGLLGRFSCSSPVIQIINYNNKDWADPTNLGGNPTTANCKNTSVVDEGLYRPAEVASNSPQLPELPEESSTVGRVELPADSIHVLIQSGMFSVTERPPFVNYATKPKIGR